MRQRILVVGWDGADWDIVDDLLSRGLLPNLEQLIARGGRGTLLSTVPSHSWSAWSSFLTGYNPAGHGVWDFVERDPTDPDRRIPVSSTSIRRTTFLDRLSAAGVEVRAANIPVTFPAWEINGRMIGGVAIPPRASFVTPSDFATELRERAPFPINGLEWMKFERNPDRLIDDARHLVQQRTSSFEVLLEGSWDVAVCVFLAPDRLQHPLGAFLLPTHPLHDQVTDSPMADALRGVYRLVDEALGRLVACAGPDALTIVMSDHGFRPVERQANLTAILRELGFAAAGSRNDLAHSVRRWAPTRAITHSRVGYALKHLIRAPAMLDWSRTVAYSAGTSGAISVNLKGREIHGTVEPADYDTVRRDVAEALLSYRNADTGDQPVAGVLLREDLPDGDHADLGPDLLARPAPLWSFRANIDAQTQSSRWPSGDHRQEGILVASQAAAADLGPWSITDMAPTLLAMQGLTASGVDGHPISMIARDTGDLLESDHTGSVEADAVTREEQEEVAQHLRDLGYIE
ncbi:MAG TPA: alkaline phosphatase family protein [Actinomycetota bacterium]|nr:alkaline phosphatase family protein [Actinomycetota bacterium]